LAREAAKVNLSRVDGRPILLFPEKLELLMAGRTLSAYADEETYREVTELARLEDRSTAQILAAALRLYMRLPRAAHDALRQPEAAGEDQAETAGWVAGRALLALQYDVAVSEGLRHTPPIVSETDDEDAILAKSVELTRSDRT
jgi:hypothetical protein